MDRLRLKKTMRQPVVGVSWYNEDNWARVKLAATDSERFEESYLEWLEMALDALANIQKTGINAVQFNIDADELLPWCLANKKANNAAARAEFIAEKLRT